MTTAQPSFRAHDGAGVVIDPVTPEALRPFLDQCVEFVTLTNAERGEEQQAQAWPSPTSRWEVQLRQPGLDHHLRGSAPNTDAAFDILRSWAAGDDWWSEAFSWEPVQIT